MTRRRILCSAFVAALGAATFASPVSADDATFDDPVDDVVTGETFSSVDEPRVDVTQVFVHHEVDRLEITVTVDQFTALDDPVWASGQLALQGALADESSDDPFGGFWLWALVPGGDGEATGVLTSFDTFSECSTEARADAESSTYTLSAGPECLRDVPRSVSIGASLSFDPDPLDETFDTPFDQAPDDLSDPVGSTGAPRITRLAGPDRIETAIALSIDRYGDGGAGAAVLASSADHPDAIAGGPLAARHDAPLLLSGPELDPRVAAELERAVEPGAVVYLLGGTGALGDPVSAELRRLGFRPQRLAGTNRFETAIAIADEIGDHALTIIADGRSFRDGLVAGAAAAALGGVVVLSDGATLPPATDDFLATDATRHVAIGLAATAAPGTERITAPSAPELSQKVLDRLLPNANAIAVAGVRTFADALAGAPHIAARGGGLLLTESDALAPAVAAELEQRASDVRELVLYGGTASLSTAVEDAISAAVS